MKIPETTPSVGAYYGNEENGQWQGNGVMLDSGVGGGVVGSGDAGFVHHVPPHYAVRPHVPPPGFVMAGAFYPPPIPIPAPPPDDFADYMWMENEEEFDKEVMQQLEEEALMEQCIEAMLEDERERERNNRPVNGHGHAPTTSNGVSSLSLEEQVSKSTLNPLAAEFVPTFARGSSSTSQKETTEEKQSTTEEPKPEEANQTTEETPASPEVTPPAEIDIEKKKEIAEPDTPEVSAADVQPICHDDKPEKRPKETKESKKPVKVPEPVKKMKVDPKPAKSKPQIVRSEPKLALSKEDKSIKSEESLQETDAAVNDVKVESTPVEEPSSGIKPINYAAAAKATKAKKSTPPPTVTEKTTAPSKTVEKTAQKSVKNEKSAPRKNSMK